ncbi:MAG: DUF5688 family protein [Clostridiales bacterium]|nr:DUF5688 family protein [Clostridiales bacterium]
MDFEEFIAEVERGITAKCVKGSRACIYEVLADNGIRKQGIYIMREETQRITPVVYLDDFYPLMEHGEKMEEIMDRIQENLKQSEQAAEECLKMMQKLETWEAAKDQIYPFLLPEGKNEEMFEIFAGRKMLDLDVFYMFRSEIEGMGFQRVRLKKAMLEQWGVTEPEVFQQAVENLSKDGYSVRNMGEVLRSLVPGCAEAMEEAEEAGVVDMFLFTNDKMNYGAAGILLGNEYFRQAMGGRNFYVLPSSQHELIFVPGEWSEEGERLSGIVREVNEQMLAEDEVLSDHAYYYDVEQGFMLAA